MHRRLSLRVVPGSLAIARLEPGAAIPAWALAAGAAFASVTRTADELSIVCAEAVVPEAVRSERGWRALAVRGPLDFALTGVLAALLAPLADAGVSVFALSTFDTDWLLVKQELLARAVAALRAAGHAVEAEPPARPTPGTG